MILTSELYLGIKTGERNSLAGCYDADRNIYARCYAGVTLWLKRLGILDRT